VCRLLPVLNLEGNAELGVCIRCISWLCGSECGGHVVLVVCVCEY
jgi:hypothetical protein